MINCQREKIVLFIHLPKCAGTTVIKSLCRVGPGRFAIVSQSPASKLQAQEDLQRQIAARNSDPEQVLAVMGHDVYYGIHDFSSREPFYCTFLRDPVERYVSHFHYLIDAANDRASPIHQFARQQLVENGKLLTLDETVERRLFSNLMTGYLAAANHRDLATHRWGIPGGRHALRRAENLIDKLDFIGLVENMTSDLEFICRQLGVEPVATKYNASARVESPPADALIDRIRTINRFDEQLYRYAIKRRHALGDSMKWPILTC